jgi:hypothetical protein
MYSSSTATRRKFRNTLTSLFKKTPQSAYSIGSILGFAAINYTIIHSPFVLLAVFVLLVHELAHYFYAKSFGAKANLPIILPLPFIAIGFVKVKHLLDQFKSDVAIAGLIFGSLTIFLFSLLNIFTYFISFYILAIMLFFEIFFNLIGSDGSKYRKYSRS